MTKHGRHTHPRAARRARWLASAALPVFATVAAGSACAQSATPSTTPSQNTTAAAMASPGDPGFTTGLFAASRNNLLGDIWGLRTWLGTTGITLGAQETSEDLGNVTGGIHRGFDYDGLTVLNLQVDTQKAFGWSGGTFNISAEQIHGRSVSQDNLDNLQTASGIEATPSTRLWELWYEQSLADGKLDVKIGQQSLDQEFIISTGSALYLNTVMGWPLIPSDDMYAGGPAYPLSSLGVRVRLQPTAAITVLAGVFDDNPPGGSFANDSQVRGAEQSGTEFNLGTGALTIAEVQYAVNQPATGQMVTGDGPAPDLPGTYRLGAWYDSATFPDQRTDTTGLSLADPNSSGIGGPHRGNWSVYAIADQMVWRPDPQSSQSVGVFLRVMGAPSDRNLISFSTNGGVNLKAPFASRPNDTVGIGFGVGQVSRVAAAFDVASGKPARTVETFIEATYQYQIDRKSVV